MRLVLLLLIPLTLCYLIALASAVPLHLQPVAPRPARVHHVSELPTPPTHAARQNDIASNPPPARKEAAAPPHANRPPTVGESEPGPAGGGKEKKGNREGEEKQSHVSDAESPPDADAHGEKDHAPHQSDAEQDKPADTKKQPEGKGRDDARQDPNADDDAETGAGEGDIPKPDDAKTDDAVPDHAEPDDAKPHDSRPGDAKPDDPKPEDSKPHDSKPKDPGSGEGSPSEPESVPEVPKGDADKDKEAPRPRVSSPMTFNAPLIGMIAFAVAVLIGGFVVGTQTSLCGFGRASDGQQYQPVSRQDGAQTEGGFGEMSSDPADAEGWNDGWEQDDWDAEETAKA